MTAQTCDGFLLTRNWRDTPGGVELEFWFAGAAGPLCVLVRGERSVFFLSRADLESARGVLSGFPGVEVKTLELRDFRMAPVAGLYFPGHRQARRCADALRAAGLEPLEADINPAERYLMERFIYGGARLHGEVRRRGRYLTLENPQMRPVDFRPALKVVSLDIETAMDGLQLYSIGVHGTCPDQEDVRKVFMVGSAAEVPAATCVQPVATQEQALAAFLDWLDDYDPDVMIGWNVVNFDARYLQRVADHLGRRLLLHDLQRVHG